MELVRKSIPCFDVILDNVSAYEESTDAIVPDAFPDIARIIYAGGIVSVKDLTPQSDRVLVSGTVAACVLYQPEADAPVQRLDIPLSFAHIEEARGVDAESRCFVRCSAADVCARAVNSRKVSVTVKLCFEITAYQAGGMQYTEQIQAEDPPLEVLYDTQEIYLLRDVACQSFTVLDDLEWSGAEGLELLHTDCTLRQKECRAMNGRLLLRGEAALHLLLRDDTGAVQQAEQGVSFTQMLELDGLSEGERPAVRLAVRSLDCVLTPGGVLSVGIGVDAAVLRDQAHKVQTIRDLYQTKHELHTQVAPVKVRGSMLCGGFTADGTAGVPLGMKASQYLGARAVCTGLQAGEDGLHARLDAQILYMDEEGALYQAHRALHVPLRVSALPPDAWLSDPEVQAAMSPSGEDAVSLHLTLTGLAVSRPQHIFQDVTAVELGAARESARDVSLILRRVDEGEKLWDLAKAYATTAAAIRSANGMAQDQQTTKAQMLLIPVEQ